MAVVILVSALITVGTLALKAKPVKPVSTLVTTSPSPRASPGATATPAATINNHWVATGSVDPKALPLGDGKVSHSAPATGVLYTCQQADPKGGGAQVAGPWIHGTSWDSTAKVEVQGQVSWNGAYSETVTATSRVLTTNDLPENQSTGTFPIARSDPAHAYDANPNKIVGKTATITLPLNPTALAAPACAPGGPEGILNDGVYLFNPLDALNRDAVAHETQDKCDGHPAPGDLYHYHNVPSCLRKAATAQSNLIGWAYDGYPIYVERDASGNLPTNQDLDTCHGRSSPVILNGKVLTTYHYDATLEFPYVIGCFHAVDAVPAGTH